MDVFALDAMTEMLGSPLHLLSYLNRRAHYSDRLMITHEHTLLSYHLKHNLWIDDDVDMITLDDGIGTHLDVAMTVRRVGVPGSRDVDGILTRFKARAVGKVISQLEANSDPNAIALGMFLLRLGENALGQLDAMLQKISASARADGENHDASIAVASSGLTVHCNDRPDNFAKSRLLDHCKLRKHVTKAERWLGIVMRPRDFLIRQVVSLEFPWKPDSRLDELAKTLASRRSNSIVKSSANKPGRNGPCPCGSGRKFKRCCGSVSG
jgi:hypothetical protein